MAVNDSRSMNVEFAQGTIDSTYIQLTPDRANVENPPVERLSWPTYAQAELHKDPPHFEAHARRAGMPVEFKTAQSRLSEQYGSDHRF